MIFVTLGSLDGPEAIEPVLEMFTERRHKSAKPLDLPQFEEYAGLSTSDAPIPAARPA
jgi:hypothetical protein